MMNYQSFVINLSQWLYSAFVNRKIVVSPQSIHFFSLVTVKIFPCRITTKKDFFYAYRKKLDTLRRVQLRYLGLCETIL